MSLGQMLVSRREIVRSGRKGLSRLTTVKVG